MIRNTKNNKTTTWCKLEYFVPNRQQSGASLNILQNQGAGSSGREIICNNNTTKKYSKFTRCWLLQPATLRSPRLLSTRSGSRRSRRPGLPPLTGTRWVNRESRFQYLESIENKPNNQRPPTLPSTGSFKPTRVI